MHTMSQAGYKDRRYCPHCRCGICCKTESYDDQMMRKPYSTSINCNLELPDIGSTMNFKKLQGLTNETFYSLCGC